MQNIDSQPVKSAISLLNGIATVIKHEREVERIKGEKFNVFSILGLERLENRTHSAFLCELLDVNGSHLMGDIFLKLFLQHFNLVEHIDLTTAKTVVEHHIGGVDLDKGEGGRIDIFIWDHKGHCISIENKIDAGDQALQVVRYCKYRADKNKVLYLTKDGRDASKESRGGLVANVDYNLCSYKTDIITWLGECIKEVAEVPIVRESIKQYLLLIKKITHTMDSKAQKELLSLMLNHYEEAAYIADNFAKIRIEAGESIRQEVIRLLGERLGEEYVVEGGNPTTNTYSQIWIWDKSFPETQLYFGIESFSGYGWMDGNLFIGIFNEGPEISSFPLEITESPINKWWITQQSIDDFGGYVMNMKNQETLKKICLDNVFKRDFIEHVVQQVEEYLRQKTPALRKFLNSEVVS